MYPHKNPWASHEISMNSTMRPISKFNKNHRIPGVNIAHLCCESPSRSIPTRWCPKRYKWILIPWSSSIYQQQKPSWNSTHFYQVSDSPSQQFTNQRKKSHDFNPEFPICFPSLSACPGGRPTWGVSPGSAREEETTIFPTWVVADFSRWVQWFFGIFHGILGKNQGGWVGFHGKFRGLRRLSAWDWMWCDVFTGNLRTFHVI